MRTPRGKKKAVESVLVIATKGKAAFLEEKKDQDLTITDLMKELSAMGPSQWVEQTAGYESREQQHKEARGRKLMHEEKRRKQTLLTGISRA